MRTKIQCLTPSAPLPSLLLMEVPLSPDLQQKLSRLAAERGRAADTLAVEAIERLVNYDEWFLREVGKGIEAAEAGKFVDHEAVGKLIDERYRG